MSDIFSHTIAALSTPAGKGGIAVIRISGQDCFSIVSKVFIPRSGKSLLSYGSSRAIFGDLYYEGEIIDNGLCTVFFAPHSYTGENTAEISCHGSELGVSLILSSLLKAGAVPAGPGEFTRRAFLNGKLTLTQAEAVGELIDADSTAALRLSNAKVSGKLAQELSKLSEQITDVLASVYAGIDYPDEDLAELTCDEMKEQLSNILNRLDRLCRSYNSGRAIAGGIPAAIVGLPNSGKSSLLNLLTGTDRAIVTDVAGTTRDVITEKVVLGNISLLLSDTAGLRETSDTVEQIGVQRAKKSMEEAELILAVIDGTTPLSPEETALLELLNGFSDKHILILLNKKDTGSNKDKETALHSLGFEQPVALSAKTGDGKDELIRRIGQFYPAGDADIRSGLILTGARIYAAVNGARSCVEDALLTLQSYTPDVAGTDLERALQYLAEADGRSVTEEIVNRIFSRFCVGK